MDASGALFPLFDTHGDGHLDSNGVERVVDAAVLSVTSAAERCYGVAARQVLDKKSAKVMPKTMKYALMDALQVPLKRRCAFAWAENRKQVRVWVGGAQPSLRPMLHCSRWKRINPTVATVFWFAFGLLRVILAVLFGMTQPLSTGDPSRMGLGKSSHESVSVD